MEIVKCRDSYGDIHTKELETKKEASAFMNGMYTVISEFSCDMSILEEED